MKRATWFILCLLLGVSCLDQPDCFRQNINLMGLSFKKIVGGKADTVDVAVIAHGEVDGIFQDGILISGLAVQLDYLKNQTFFSFITREKGYSKNIEILDTLLVGHDSKPQFVSEECGQRFVVSNLKVIHHTFDRANVVSTSLSNPAQPNITLYRCPRTNIVRLSFRQLYTDKISRGKLEDREIDSVYTPLNGLYTKGPQSSVLLPLDQTTTSSTFNFKFKDGEENAIKFTYDVGSILLADDCGEQKLFSNLAVTTSSNSIVRVLQSTVQNPPATNVEVYRCPVTNNIKLLFKELKGNSKIAKQVVLKSVKTDFLTEAIYTNSSVSEIVLPLNPDVSKSTTTFTFEFESGEIKKLQLTYAVVEEVFHDDCGAQPVYSNIKIQSTDQDFTQVPTILDGSAKFPTASNIESIL